MSRTPMGASLAGGGNPFPKGFMDRYGTHPNQGIGAEMVAEKWGFDRTTLDEFSLGSHEKAPPHRIPGHSTTRSWPIKDSRRQSVLKEEGIRRGTPIEKMAQLKPAFKEDGVIRAGNSSPDSDGSAALLFMSAEKAKSLGLRPITQGAHRDAGRRRSGDHADRADSRHPEGVEALRSEDRRDRCVRGERGVRAGAAGLAGRHRRRREEARTPNGGAIALGHPPGRMVPAS